MGSIEPARLFSVELSGLEIVMPHSYLGGVLVRSAV